MSNVGQGVLAVAGGVIGAFVGGPTGALYGFQLGLLAGQVVSPTQGPTVQRPRLTDVGTTSSNVGDPIAWGMGTYPATGEIGWQSDLREVEVETDEGGKGAPSSTVETPTYFQDFWIGLDDAEDKVFGGIRRIWANGKIIYDRRPQQDGEAANDFHARMALSDSLDQIMTVYLGTEDQMPDPTFEMRQLAKTGEKVSALRGLAYVVFANWQNKAEDGNRMPQTWKFECYTSGSSTNPDNEEYSNDVLYDWDDFGLADPRDALNQFEYQYDVAPTRATLGDALADAQADLGYGLVAQTGWNTDPGAAYSYRPFYPDTYPANPGDPDSIYLFFNSREIGNISNVPWDGVLGLCAFIANLNAPVYWSGRETGSPTLGATHGVWLFVDNAGPFPPDTTSTFSCGPNTLIVVGDIPIRVARVPQAPRDPALVGVPLNGLSNFYVDKTTGTITKGGAWTLDSARTFNVMQVLSHSTEGINVIRPLNPCLPQGHPNDTEAFWTAAYDAAVAAGTMPPGLLYGTGYPAAQGHAWVRSLDHTTIDTAPILIADVVKAVCKQCGYADDEVDTTQIDELTIIGYMRNQVMTGRGVLDPLRSLGFFDVIESDGKVKCVARGNAPVRELTVDDLGAFSSGDQAPPAITSTTPLDTDLPVQVRVSYLSPSRDLEPNQQLSLPRVNTDAVGVTDIDLAAVIDDDRAAQIAEVLADDIWQSRNLESISLDQSQLELEPTDVITIPLDGSVQRVRISDVTDKDQMLRAVSLIRDDSFYSSLATAEVSAFTRRPIYVPSPIEMIMLDIPLLRDADNDAGFYIAVRPWLKSSAAFGGGSIYKSTDDTGYSKAAGFNSAATIGTLTAALPAAPYDVLDYANPVQVTLDYGTLSNVTLAQLLAGQNAAAVGADGRWEIIQFLTAVDAGGGRMTLTGLARGRRGTEHAIGSSVKDDRFVLLNGNGLARVVLNNADIGAARFYKGVPIGGTVEGAESEEFTGHGEALKPFSPVALAGSRSESTGDWTLTWIRRGRIGQAMPSGADIALSEASELYDVEILDAGVVARTFSAVSVKHVLYSAADQTTDFGNTITTISFRVYQLSAIVGRGYPGEATVTDDAALLPPSPSEFVPANEDKPVILASSGGRIVVAKIGTLGGRSVVGIIVWNGSGDAVCTSTTYGFGGVPRAYFYELDDSGRRPIPQVADNSDTSWSVYWRSQPFPDIDSNVSRWLLSNTTGGDFDELEDHPITDAMLVAGNINGLYRSLLNHKTYAMVNPSSLYSSSDSGHTFTLDGAITGTLSAIDPLATFKIVAYGSAVLTMSDLDLEINAGGDLIDWAHCGVPAAMITAGYGSSSYEFIDFATDGTHIIAVVQAPRDSDGALFNLILTSSDATTWTVTRAEAFQLGFSTTAGCRWISAICFGGKFGVYGHAQFGGGFPKMLLSGDLGLSWSSHTVATGALDGAAFLYIPHVDSSGNVIAITSSGSRIIAPATTPSIYGVVSTSGDGITFTPIAEFA